MKFIRYFLIAFTSIILFVLYSSVLIPKTYSAVSSCKDVGVETNNSYLVQAQGCMEGYNICKGSLFTFTDPDAYAKCVYKGGCWDIGRAAELEGPDNCPIDENNKLDYTFHRFQESSFQYEGNMQYCECIVACNAKYRVKKDCESELKSCCEQYTGKDEGFITSNDVRDLTNLSYDEISAMLPDMCRDENSKSAQIYTAVSDIVRKLIIEMTDRLDVRNDLTNEEKEIITKTFKKVQDNFVIRSCGSGSEIGGCNWYTLWSTTCIKIDPLSSPDVIKHEIGHWLAEKLLKGYKEPQGDSSHEIAGYCSTTGRATDEALANLIALDLGGTTEFYSFAKLSTTDIFKMESMRNQKGYYVNFNDKSMKLYNNLQSIEEYGPNNTNKSSEWYWFGLNYMDYKKREDVKAKIKQYQSEFNQIFQELKTSFNLQDVKDRLTRKSMQMDIYIRMLNPPAYANTSEVAVTSLLYDISGTRPKDYRIGKIIKASNAYLEKTGRFPDSELNILQGFLLAYPDSKQKVIDLIQSDKHRRFYYQLSDLEI